MKYVKFAAGVCFVMTLVIIGRLVPVTSSVAMLVGTIQGTGLAGVALFFLTYIGVSALMLPGALLAMVAGFAYGPGWGMLVAWPASIVAGTCAFLLGRTVLRHRVQQIVSRSDRTRALDRAVGRGGFKLVLLLRMSPVAPFSILNYAFGLSSIPLRDFVVASVIGELPGVWLYVYLGSIVTTATQLSTDPGRWTTPQLAVYTAGMAATVAALVLLGRIATRALRSIDVNAAEL